MVLKHFRLSLRRFQIEVLFGNVAFLVENYPYVDYYLLPHSKCRKQHIKSHCFIQNSHFI